VSEELSDPGKPRIWKAVEYNDKMNQLLTERIESFEKMFERHLIDSTSIYSDVKKTNLKLEENGLKLERVLAILERHDAEIKNLWAFPLKMAAAFITFAGASSAAYAFVKWVIPKLDVGGHN
jgi:hypothetical protein